MKKLLAFGLLVFLGFAPHVLAQGFTALAPIPGLTDPSSTSVINSQSLASFFNNLYKYLIGLAAILAVIQIVWAGIDMAFFHKDSVSAITDDKGKIYNAIFGLVLVLSPVLVFSIINPSILNLSLNLPPIDLKTVTGTAPPSNTTVINQKNINDVGGSIATAQAACRNKGGTPILDSSNLVGGGTASVTCNMNPPVQAGQQVTQQTCINMSPPGIPFFGFTCATMPTSATSFQQAGGYVCNDMTGGGICFHK